MTDFLIKTFIRDYKNTDNASVRTAYGKFSSVIGIICNALLFMGKILAGTLSGSVAITADAFNNLSDASSSIISLLGFKLASKPADEEHPYGHGRYEYLAGLTVAVLIMVIGVELFQSSFKKIINPSPVEFRWISIVVLLLSIVLKLWMSYFNKKIGKRISSGTLIATAADSRNDVIATSGVLFASVFSYFTDINLDGWVGLAVALFILYSGFGLIRDTLDPLVGKAPEMAFVEEIQNKIISYPGVLGTHDLILHDYGPGRQFASVHVEMAAEEDVIVSHDVIDNIERDFLKEKGLHLIIHFDPIATKDSVIANIRQWLSEEVKIIDPMLTIHDLRVVPGTTHTNLIFDCVAPRGLEMTDGELRAAVSILVKKSYSIYHCSITIDRSYSPLPPVS